MANQNPKARVLSSNARVLVKDYYSGQTILIGEVDSFSAKSTTSLIKSRPIGTAIETGQAKYGGYDLSFEGGKVDWELAQRMHANELILRSIGDNFLFNIHQEILYYDGYQELYSYNDVVLFGYSLDIKSGDELKESVSGFAPQRNTLDPGSIGKAITGFMNIKVKNAISSAIDAALDSINPFS